MRQKKNLLYICHRIPYPPNKGDKIRSYNNLKYLSKKYNVYLACMLDDKKDLSNLHKLHPFVKDIFYDLINPRWKKICSITAFITSRPISVPYFYSSYVQQSIDELLDQQPIDIIFCFSSPTAEYIFRSKHYHGNLRNEKWIMDLVDLDSYKWRQYSETCRFPMSWVYKLEAKYLLLYEKRISIEFQQILLATEAEKSLFSQYVSTTNAHAVGNGVDFNFFTPSHQTTIQKKSPVMIFTGVMDYFPNIDGVKWFVHNVFPLILKDIPEVKFYVVGRQPSAEIRALGKKKGVVVTGFVEDVRDYYSIADVCLIPLRIARGIQNKLLEAMAMEKAVVCTPQALDGIEGTSDRELLIAKEKKEFADSVVKILSDKPYKVKMGKCARLFIKKNYSWDRNLNKLEHLFIN